MNMIADMMLFLNVGQGLSFPALGAWHVAHRKQTPKATAFA